MYYLSAILSWITSNAEGVRLSRAKTHRDRVMSLGRLADHLIQIARCSIEDAFKALRALPA